MKPECDFSFDEWASLARVDPAAFEVRRKAVIAEFLNASGAQQPIGEALQREIDAVRSRAETPVAALVSIATMLSDQLAFLGEELAALEDDLGEVRQANERVHALIVPNR